MVNCTYKDRTARYKKAAYYRTAGQSKLYHNSYEESCLRTELQGRRKLHITKLRVKVSCIRTE
jgi:hypothetical protein